MKEAITVRQQNKDDLKQNNDDLWNAHAHEMLTAHAHVIHSCFNFAP